MRKEFCYTTFNNLKLWGTYYSAKETSSTKPLIVYFHGGGLIYGNRDDLPQEHLEIFLDNGYSVITLDYPLIPEVKIDVVLECLKEGIHYVSENFQQDFIYFGRSAGAFLALQLANCDSLIKPKKIISFYGYYSLNEPLLHQASDYYKKVPIVPFMTVHHLKRKQPIKEALIEERFPIYLSFRQSGTWVKELLGRKNEINDFSLTTEDLQKLPPIFVAASEHDQDIPFQINQELVNQASNATCFFVKDLPHDFDADPIREAAISCYKEVIKWLEK
ncbi:alpha/beta hydrolase [Vagococcus carniphilus]|uniref:alpha/beta hydrolase n=1 Tax=Vagococcus carniphilus TaxID=218144 RepID=UPI00288EEDA5|nr:alpha/beta hydrolase [Vagococcus carniphilus]MDT2814283.1 alpha/beta hydrolase [Vagococcus carniphilus]MDT2864470.1 alpha/beta hydrolase [Vagococcus carniphilus]